MILVFQIAGVYLISDFHSLCFLASRFSFSLCGITPVIDPGSVQPAAFDVVWILSLSV